MNPMFVDQPCVHVICRWSHFRKLGSLCSVFTLFMSLKIIMLSIIMDTLSFLARQRIESCSSPSKHTKIFGWRDWCVSGKVMEPHWSVSWQLKSSFVKTTNQRLQSVGYNAYKWLFFFFKWSEKKATLQIPSAQKIVMNKLINLLWKHTFLHDPSLAVVGSRAGI